MNAQEPVEVYVAWKSIEAHVVRNLLAEAGIEAWVVGDKLEPIRGKVPFQTVSCSVLVAPADAERARAIVAEWEPQPKPGAGAAEAAESFCYHCGQAVAGRPAVCPGCGGALDWSE
jgi:hypothetical protein